MENRAINIIAFLLLSMLFLTAVLSMKDDSLTFDELAHIPAGYSYLTKQDYRLNPEHPPLVKDIPALPLLFLNLNFPDESPNWLQKDSSPPWWVQFDLGMEFIYGSGNNPRAIIFWPRLAMVVLLVFTGWLLYVWTRKTANNVVALLALTLFAFSPTFLAHGHLGNTDLGAAFGALLAAIFWLKFLDKPYWKNVLFAGLALGVALLLKFSLILLIPFFVIITFLYAFLFSVNIWQYIGKAVASGLIAFILVIWPVYQFHIWNYPAEQQIRDTIADISGHPVPFARDLTFWMAESDFFRAPAQYFRGLLMASQRTAWGNTTYFLGEVSADARLAYFPLLYLVKETLAFQVLSLLALCFLALWFWHALRDKENWLESFKGHFWILAFLIWILGYWVAALAGNLNIGIRHLMPALPFTYILVVFAIWQGIKRFDSLVLRRALAAIAFIMFLWHAVSSFLAFPHYISYYNKLGGGISEGYQIAVDSNYDWGQDFYRLLAFVEEEKIDKIYVDYFGGESVQYWLGEKYIRLNPREITEPPKGWLAVSTNHLMGGLAKPVQGFDQETGYYNWLKGYTPVAKAGHSIFIYKID
ncbi:MAG: hypothetical protein G01um101430_202 [Parcubacteria group bacterium Gr01-1014_30]|nr:MAG: hypothetical protein G01um101430_202 [Parcubacteria group bacterium Gr01-1014_30]